MEEDAGQRELPMVRRGSGRRPVWLAIESKERSSTGYWRRGQGLDDAVFFYLKSNGKLLKGF